MDPSAAAGRGSSRCRGCGAPLRVVVIDLGVQPPCERFLAADQLDEMEPFYPLRMMVCEQCWLAQVGEYVLPEEIFTEYAYFSSFSASWLEHARRYAVGMRDALGLGPDSLVIEVASNDGYLLRHFRDLGIPVLGIEPAANVARAAEELGIPTEVRFFGRALARELVEAGRRPALMAGNNVLAQVPDLDDFLGGFAIVLPPEGVLTLEFPHLLRLLEGRQFDTIYHEHFSYFSLRTVQRLLEPHGLAVTDVAELPTHGGSLRVTIRHAGAAEPGERVAKVLGDEATAGLETLAPYAAFAASAEAVKRDLLAFLIEAKRGGKRVVGYGAPGKANTLLNWCGIRTDLVAFTVDRNPYKHGRFTPGTRIPILPPERLAEARPDYVWILPWNLAPEIQVQLAGIGEWGGRFVTAIPSLTVGAPGRAAVA